MRRHVISVRGGRRNLGVQSRRFQPLLCQHRIVIAMNDVMRDAWMVRLLLENRLKNFAALALVGKCLVRLRRGDRQRQSVKNGRFTVARISTLQLGGFFFIEYR